MKHVMSKLVMSAALACSVSFADQQPGFDLETSTRLLQEDMIARGVEDGNGLAKQPVVEGVLQKPTATIGVAKMTSSGYTFNWMVFSGGWYWTSSDEYSTFYDLDQRHEDFSKYKAILTLHVYRTSRTPLQAAETDMAIASLNNATVFENKSRVDFAGQPAYHNSYAYSSNGYSWSVDTWSLSHAGTTYRYRILTTVDDWNKNVVAYSIYKLGLSFDDEAFSKRSINATQADPMVSYYPSATGGIQFKGTESFDNIYIYDLSGSLVRTITGGAYWDGRDSDGNAVKTGYYVSNLQTDGSTVNMKVLRR